MGPSGGNVDERALLFSYDALIPDSGDVSGRLTTTILWRSLCGDILFEILGISFFFCHSVDFHDLVAGFAMCSAVQLSLHIYLVFGAEEVKKYVLMFMSREGRSLLAFLGG